MCVLKKKHWQQHTGAGTIAWRRKHNRRCGRRVEQRTVESVSYLWWVLPVGAWILLLPVLLPVLYLSQCCSQGSYPFPLLQLLLLWLWLLLLPSYKTAALGTGCASWRSTLLLSPFQIPSFAADWLPAARQWTHRGSSNERTRRSDWLPAGGRTIWREGENRFDGWIFGLCLTVFVFAGYLSSFLLCFGLLWLWLDACTACVFVFYSVLTVWYVWWEGERERERGGGEKK